MKETFKKLAKAVIIWFAAGALFALAANAVGPLIGGEVGALAQGINSLWLGTLLAGTSAIATLAEPLMNAVFGSEAPAHAQAPTQTKRIRLVITPRQDVSVVSYQQAIENERQAQKPGHSVAG